MVMRPHFGVTKFADIAEFDLAAELFGHRLHAVADAEHRHAEIEHDLRRARRTAFGDRIRAARQNDALRRELADERVVDVVRMDLRIHM